MKKTTTTKQRLSLAEKFDRDGYPAAGCLFRLLDLGVAPGIAINLMSATGIIPFPPPKKLVRALEKVDHDKYGVPLRPAVPKKKRP